MSGPSNDAVITEPTRHRDVPVRSAPDQTTVRRLQHIRGFPAVSILLSTGPGHRLHEPDGDRLRRLAGRAEDRLGREAGGTAAADLGPRLRRLVERAFRMPVDRALGLYLHARHAEIVRLPMAVPDRVVVAETFAAGDIVMADRYAPEYRLLRFTADGTWLFAGKGERLEERFAGRAARRRADFRRIDETVESAGSDPAGPLVLAGDPSLTARFRAITARPERVVGTVNPGDSGPGPDGLARAAGRLMTAHRARLERQVLADLPAALSAGRVAAGLNDVWPAVIGGDGETLLVEESLRSSARLSGDGRGLHPASPEGGRGVVADVIGELAWAMTFYGGQTVVVAEGALRAYEGIALILRSDDAST